MDNTSKNRNKKEDEGLYNIPLPLPKNSSLLKQNVKEVPGNAATGTVSSVMCLLSIKATGHNYVRKMMRRYNSTVFRMNFFGTRITVCDDEGMQSLFTEHLVKKEPRFGSLVVNRKVYRGLIPFEYTNGYDHDQKRDFMVDYLHCVKKDWDTQYLLLTVDEEFRTIGDRLLQNDDFEDVLSNAMCNIISRSLLGCCLDYSQVRIWFQHVLVPVFKLDKWDSKPGVDATEHLAKEIEESPIGIMLMSKGKKHEFSKNEILMELLAMVLFNAHRSNSGAVISAMIYLQQLTEEQLNLLKTEATKLLNGKCSINSLVHIENFLMEILRLHPPAKSIFGIATQNFTMESQCGFFSVKEGELLCGDLYWTLRNPKVFVDPDTFVFDRFTKMPELKKYMCAFGGNYYDNIKSFHKCIGQHFSMTLLKMCICHLMFCEYEPSCEPKWTGRKITRIPASDKPFTVHTFEYRRETSGPRGARAPVDINEFLVETEVETFDYESEDGSM